MHGAVSLRDLYAKYSDQVQFLVIYIQEAHPIDGWWFGNNPVGWLLKLAGSKAAQDIHSPTTLEERQAVAQRCQDTLDYNIPTLVDGIDNSVNQAYAALPTRLYLVGVDGRVVYAGKPGPWGFSPAELGKAIEAAVGKPA